MVGLTKSETENLVKSKLKDYLKEEPVVNVRFINYKISVIGEVNRPSTFTIANEKVNVFEALAMAGDLKRRGQPDWAGADDHYGMFLLARVLGRKPRLVYLVLVIDGAAWLGKWLVHVLVSWGRCRDQTVALPSPCGLA